MNVGLPPRNRLVKLTVTGVILVVALPFVLYAIVQYLPGFGGYVVLSGSMAPQFHAGDVVFVQNVGPESVQAGDVITYHAPNGPQTVTHKVAEVVERDGQRLFQTKGIDQPEDPYLVPPRALIGVVLFHVPYLGRVLVFLQSDVGILLFVLVPLGLLIVTEVWSLVSAARRSRGADAATDQRPHEEP